METKTVTLSLLHQEAQNFLQSLGSLGKNGATVIGLYGDLGSGKTTFVKEIAKAFGVEQIVTSPTFVIEKIYKLKGQQFDHLVHIDAYRLSNSSELINLRWNEIIKDPKNIVFVEWAGRVEDILPATVIRLHLTIIDEQKREILYD